MTSPFENLARKFEALAARLPDEPGKPIEKAELRAVIDAFNEQEGSLRFVDANLADRASAKGSAASAQMHLQAAVQVPHAPGNHLVDAAKQLRSVAAALRRPPGPDPFSRVIR